MKHTRISASKMARIYECPGSMKMEAMFPDKPSAAAQSGTETHRVLEEWFRLGRPDIKTLLGIELEIEEGAFVVSQEQIDRLKVATDYIDARIEELGEDANVYSERSVDIGAALKIRGEPIQGILDILIRHRKGFEVIDYKDGRIGVEAEGNLQIIAGGLGFSSEIRFYPDDEIRLTIIQPRMTEQGLEAISWSDMSGEDLKAYTEPLRAACIAALEDDPELIPGDSQCQWCKARKASKDHPACPAIEDKVSKEIDLLFDSVVVTQQSLASRDPKLMSREKLSAVLEVRPLALIFLKGVEEEALRRMREGEDIPNFKVVRGRGTRNWFDKEAVRKVLLSMKVPKASRYTYKLLSPSQVKTLKWTTENGKSRTLSNKQQERLMRLVETSQGKEVVVVETDRREAVDFDIFKDVEVETLAIPTWLGE